MQKKISIPLIAATLFLSGATLPADDNATTRLSPPATVTSKVAQVEERQAELRDLMRKQTGLVDVTPQAVHRLLGMLQDQREQLELDEAGASGRRQGLQEAVAKLSARLEERSKSDSDEIAAQLTQVVDARAAELARIKELYARGAAAASEVSSAEANLATARAEVAKARQRTISGPAREALEEWNRQLLELSVASEERTARLKYLKKRLDELSGALGSMEAMEQ